MVASVFRAAYGGFEFEIEIPSLSGKFFEVLVGANSEPLWRLLGKIGILYLLEPVFTVLFVVNINTVWEKVMSSMRALIFRRVLVQKVIHPLRQYYISDCAYILII